MSHCPRDPRVAGGSVACLCPVWIEPEHGSWSLPTYIKALDGIIHVDPIHDSNYCKVKSNYFMLGFL